MIFPPPIRLSAHTCSATDRFTFQRPSLISSSLSTVAEEFWDRSGICTPSEPSWTAICERDYSDTNLKNQLSLEKT